MWQPKSRDTVIAKGETLVESWSNAKQALGVGVGMGCKSRPNGHSRKQNTRQAWGKLEKLKNMLKFRTI